MFPAIQTRNCPGRGSGSSSNIKSADWPLRVIRDRVEPAASPAMSVIPPKAEVNGVWANIPPKRNRKDPISFSPYLYRARSLIERFFNKIDQAVPSCRDPI
ncbi:hypothetical protein GCM10007857_72960 [Bradyrhizobium iriomotense]|uniref:Transposase DDE domain-containing protein n=1 Tax=Bradyrhizobium iriomotense TaxID=441950 RepID=A0ABQ6B9P3_9BRAD|nr:hypothetical protein GCM10007857_72960 [Bradyrhizobium iriomotense]